MTNTKTNQTVALAGSTRRAVLEGRLQGKADAALKIRVSLYAKPNAAHAAHRRLLAQDGLQMPRNRKYLTREEFATVWGADPADVHKIKDWAIAQKLGIVSSNEASRRILVEGRIDDVERAFGVHIQQYATIHGGTFRAREGSIRLPAEIAGVLDGVFGLDTRRVGRPRMRRGGWPGLPLSVASTAGAKTPTERRAAAAAFRIPAGTFLPPQIASLYRYPDNDGSGQNVAVFAFNGTQGGDPHGGYRLAALTKYFETVLGATTPSIHDVVVQGPGNDPGPDSAASDEAGDSTGEVMLDLCVVGGVTPGAKIFVYFTEFTSQGWVDALHEAIAGANDISVISISYGNPEDDPTGAWTKMGVQVVNQAFVAAQSRGITICCAAGDDGSSDQVARGAHVDFPASSPNVLGVGGTKIVATTGSKPTIKTETVWNEVLQQDGATGGGVSAVFSKPAYQVGVAIPPSANSPHQIGRGVPDVAALGDPMTGLNVIHVDGTRLDIIGGTSASAPFWASLVARLNTALKTRCGFLNPVLYTKCAKGVLRDITVGNNGAYEAGPGWDACSGLGSPDGVKLVSALGGAAKSARKSAGNRRPAKKGGSTAAKSRR